MAEKELPRWEVAKPPHRALVEVESGDHQVLRARAIWGEDGVRPHWESEDRNTMWSPNAFVRWRRIEESPAADAVARPVADDSQASPRAQKETVLSDPKTAAPLGDAPRAELTFDELRDINKLRCETAFHQVDAWKPWEWSNAMAGECGEACNITKKMNRIWPANQFKQNWNKPEDQRMAELEAKLADEIADVVIYADLLATAIGRSLGECVRQKFNEKSDEIGSPIKLRAAAGGGGAPEEPK